MSESNSNSTAVATRPQGGIVTLLEKGAGFIAPFLPEGVEIDRVYAEAQIAARDNKALLDCDGWSVIRSVARIQAWGLEIGTTAYLVPFKNQCTAIADYKGLAALMIGSGAVRAVKTEVVYEGEKFQCEMGLNPILRHQPNYTARQRGKIVAAYCILYLPFGAPPVFEVMDIEEIEAIRKSSKQWNPVKFPELPAWYAKKCTVRRAAKLMPLSPRLTKALRAIEEDAHAELGEEVGVVLADEDRPETVSADGEDFTFDNEAEIRAEEQRMLARERRG